MIGPRPRTPGPPDREAACRRKKPYTTKQRAKEAAAIRERDGAPALDVYKCEYCREWHLTQRVEEGDEDA